MTLEELFRTNYNLYLKKYSFRCGTPEDAEDVIQEAFARALKYIDAYNPDHHPIGAWFNTIIENAFRDWRKDNRLGGIVKEDIDEVGDIPVYDNNRTLDRKLLEFLIDTKGGYKRDVLRMHYIFGYHPREITQLVPLNTRVISSYLYDFKEEVKHKM